VSSPPACAQAQRAPPRPAAAQRRPRAAASEDDEAWTASRSASEDGASPSASSDAPTETETEEEEEEEECTLALRVQPRRAAAPRALRESPPPTPASPAAACAEEPAKRQRRLPARFPPRPPSAEAEAKSPGAPEAFKVAALLRAGAFAAQPVEYRARSGRALLSGCVLPDGRVATRLPSSGAEATLSASAFEEAAGSRERRPGAGIVLVALEASLKAVADALNEALLKPPEEEEAVPPPAPAPAPPPAPPPPGASGAPRAARRPRP